MIENVIVNQTVNQVSVVENKNEIKIASPGPQGPRGRTILNGVGAPAANLGIEGDFYFNTENNNFYGPKLSDTTWSTSTVIDIATTSDLGKIMSWEIGQVTGTSGSYSVVLQHNLGFHPNVTVKTSAGDVLETGIDYNSINQITLLMAQPFAGTAYLS